MATGSPRRGATARGRVAGDAADGGPDTAVHRALSQASRVRLLRALRHAKGPRSARDLADEVGLHLTTVRAHLRVLIEAGLVAAAPEERGAPGRPRVLYRAVEREADGGGYRLLAEVLAGQLAASGQDASARATKAGRAWGRYLMAQPPFPRMTAEAAYGELHTLFDRLGFEPERGDGSRMLLHRCPFLAVAMRHPDVVCAVHLGLLEGALDALGGPLTAERLDPLVEPSLCVAHLGQPPEG
jgi:predicted ArsR family transcriptional regulator